MPQHCLFDTDLDSHFPGSVPDLDLSLQTPCAERDRILAAVEVKAGETFNERAREFVLRFQQRWVRVPGARSFGH